MRRKTLLISLLISGLIVALAVLAWRLVVVEQQALTAWFISSHCESLDQIACEESDPEYLAHRVEFLIRYYEGHRKTLEGTRLALVARRDYEHTLTNALIAYQRLATNDLLPQIRAWSEKYAN